MGSAEYYHCKYYWKCQWYWSVLSGHSFTSLLLLIPESSDCRTGGSTFKLCLPLILSSFAWLIVLSRQVEETSILQHYSEDLYSCTVLKSWIWLSIIKSTFSNLVFKKVKCTAWLFCRLFQKPWGQFRSYLWSSHNIALFIFFFGNA